VGGWVDSKEDKPNSQILFLLLLLARDGAITVLTAARARRQPSPIWLGSSQASEPKIRARFLKSATYPLKFE